MQCRTCNEDVPPKFTFAIKTNVCPFCGGEIMPAKLQTILKDLKVLMDDGQEFQEEIDDWFMSNYNMKRFDPNDLQMMQHRKSGKGFSVKRSDDNSIEDNSNVDGAQPSTVFAERAGLKPKKSFKELIKEIEGRSGGAADPSEFVGNNGESEIEEDPMMKPLDIKGRKDLEDMFEQDAQSNAVLEQEKLRRLRNQTAGSGGFRRGD